ncbi:response regulator transcription factor [Streptomyces luteireticuli]|uniref:response regulator transcription factor n=1 Tax=Streptomyces luteireticuli TaxID=173858 RepID=UPI003556A153
MTSREDGTGDVKAVGHGPAATVTLGCGEHPSLTVSASPGPSGTPIGGGGPRARRSPCTAESVASVTVTDPSLLGPAIRLLRSGYRMFGPRPEPTTEDTPRREHALWKRMEQLTWRETEVVRLLLRGWRNTEIAEALDLSESTVKSHVHNLMAKLEFHNRVDMISTAYVTGLLRPGFPELSWPPQPQTGPC